MSVCCQFGFFIGCFVSFDVAIAVHNQCRAIIDTLAWDPAAVVRLLKSATVNTLDYIENFFEKYIEAKKLNEDQNINILNQLLGDIFANKFENNLLTNLDKRFVATRLLVYLSSKFPLYLREVDTDTIANIFLEDKFEQNNFYIYKNGKFINDTNKSNDIFDSIYKCLRWNAEGKQDDHR